MLQEKNVNIGLVKPLLKTFPVSGESPAALSYISIEEYPLHTQLHMELIYVAEGSIFVKVGVSNYILHAGEFTIINPFELHALYAADEPNRVCILEINRDFYDPCEEENIFVSAYSLYQDASGKDFVQIKNLLNKIFALHLFSRSGENPDVLHLPAGVAENDVQYEKILLRSLINYFELHFTHEYFLLSDDKENSLRDRAQQANRLKSILLYFYENFPQKIQLQDVADVTFINRYYISHLVKSGVGLTFSELLQHIRVEKSEIYLLGTQMPVSQIVYELGFSSYRYFSLHFKRLFDMTPAAYRKKFARQTIRYKNVTAARSTMPADIDRALAMFSKEHIEQAGVRDRARMDAECVESADADDMAQIKAADGENMVQAEAVDFEGCARGVDESIARAACESIALEDAGSLASENARVVLLKSLLEKGGLQDAFAADAQGQKEADAQGKKRAVSRMGAPDWSGMSVGALPQKQKRGDSGEGEPSRRRKGCEMVDNTAQPALIVDAAVEDVETVLPQRAVLYDTPFFPAVLLSRMVCSMAGDMVCGMTGGVMGDAACGMTGGGARGSLSLREYDRFFEERAVSDVIKDKEMNCGFVSGGGSVSAGEVACARDFESNGACVPGCEGKAVRDPISDDGPADGSGFESDGICDADCGEESDYDFVFCGEPGSIAKCGLRKSAFYLKEMLHPFLRQDMRFADSAIILPGIFLIKQQKTIEILLYHYPACADAGADKTAGVTDAGVGKTVDSASAGGIVGSADTDEIVGSANLDAGETTAPLPLARLLQAKELHDIYSLVKNCRDQCWRLDLSGLTDADRILIKKTELKFETDAFLQWERMGRPSSVDETIAAALNNASTPDHYFESYELPGESGGLYPVTLKPFHVQRISLFL